MKIAEIGIRPEGAKCIIHIHFCCKEIIRFENVKF